jgi:hypothetical protein
MKSRLFLLAALALLTTCGVSAQTQAKPPAPAAAKTDPWVSFRFLLGSWEAKTTGGVAQAQASASYAFRLELRDHVLARHSSIGSCNSPDDFDCRHSDLLYLYGAGNGPTLQAIYFDNEGHVIHYDVTTPKAGSVVFLSQAAQPGPQYRLSYELVEGTMNGKFELRMPGQADFMTYLEWSGKRL